MNADVLTARQHRQNHLRKAGIIDFVKEISETSHPKGLTLSTTSKDREQGTTGALERPVAIPP